MRRPVIVSGNLDSRFGAAGVDYLAAADINSHVVYRPALGVKYQIPGLELRSADACPHTGLGSGRVRQRYPVFSKNAQYKTGAVGSLCKACTAPYIRIAKELLCVLAQIHSHIRNALAVHKLCHGNRRI